jgi:hypothetical protein
MSNVPRLTTVTKFLSMFRLHIQDQGRSQERIHDETPLVVSRLAYTYPSIIIIEVKCCLFKRN